mgnify:CR=1 FL=1
MKIIKRGEAPKLYYPSPIVGRKYTCTHCKTEFIIDAEDMFLQVKIRSVMDIYKHWYEANIPRNLILHTIDCPCCGREVKLDKLVDKGFQNYAIELLGEKVKKRPPQSWCYEEDLK